jgi:hypothetical protein
MTRCTASHGYPPYLEKCGGWLDYEGVYHDHCGDPCSFIMMKSGAGDPPFRRRSQIYVGDIPVGPLED